MRPVTATFRLLAAPDRKLEIITTIFESVYGSLNLVFDLSPSLSDGYNAARRGLEHALEGALDEENSDLTVRVSSAAEALSWNHGIRRILASKPSEIKLTMSSETLHLLPEMVPITEPGAVTGDTEALLDDLYPIYRSLDHVEIPNVQRFEDTSVAILYSQDAAQLADQLLRRLAGKGLSVDTYPGAYVAVLREDVRHSLLLEIFRQHRAVIFLGGSGDHGTGWSLTSELTLTFTRLEVVLGRGNRAGTRQGLGSIPEVIFTTCSGRGRRADLEASTAESGHPRTFLDAGVPFVIGTWMDIPEQAWQPGKVRESLEGLIEEFFGRWAEQPHDVIRHLFEAKKACAYRPLARLFQLYASSRWASPQPIEPRPKEAPIAPPVAEPIMGALVSGLGPGDRLDAYELVAPAWSSAYSRTFWARHSSENSAHLVEILVDEWQDRPHLTEDLEAALHRLHAADLGGGHLVPRRHCRAGLSRDGDGPQQKLSMLVYDCPCGDGPEAWSELSDTFPEEPSGRFERVRQLGGEAAQRLDELHRRGLWHSNLTPGSLRLRRAEDQEARLVLKDIWVGQVRPGEYTGPRYAPPEEPAPKDGTWRMKGDCWSLGAILLELTTGESSADPRCFSSQERSLSDICGARVPKVLDRVISECLVPAAQLRPPASFIARRLQLAEMAGGDFVGHFEEQLHLHIQAGHRLFTVPTDDLDQVEAALRTMASRRHWRRPRGREESQPSSYHLYVAAEDRGLIDCRSGTVLSPWIDAQSLHAQLRAEARRNRSSEPPFPIPPDVALFNSLMIFELLGALPAVDEIVSVVLIRGNRWWDLGPRTWSFLKRCQEGQTPGPVLVISDTVIGLPMELARAVPDLPTPHPSPAALFERIMAFPGELSGTALEEVTADDAIELAGEFFPCTRRELDQALRLCALEHGAIDQRALLIRDEERQRRLGSSGATTFVPVAKLPDPRTFGLPPDLEAKIAMWAVRSGLSGPGERDAAPRRLMIEGPAGTGKTTLAHVLAAHLRRPLIRVDASRCLTGGLGRSEAELRGVLGGTGIYHGVVVLLDDVDRFFNAEGAGTQITATVTRMASLVLDWLDVVPAGVIAVLTATEPHRLSAQWRRRVEWRLRLDEPRDVDARRAIFAAVLRRVGLHDLADDVSLTTELAARTDPVTGVDRLPSPLARKASARSVLGTRTVRLRTGADIAAWVEETILLHSDLDHVPEATRFWQEAVEPRSVAVQ